MKFKCTRISEFKTFQYQFEILKLMILTTLKAQGQLVPDPATRCTASNLTFRSCQSGRQHWKDSHSQLTTDTHDANNLALNQ